LPEAFCVQRVSTFLAEHQFILGVAMHALITDGTAILGSRNTPLRIRRRRCRCSPGRACISFTHPDMGQGIWRLWCVCEYAFEFVAEQGPTIDSSVGIRRRGQVCPTFDTTIQKTLEPGELSHVPSIMNEHGHV